MNIKMMGKKVLVEEKKMEATSESGIILSSSTSANGTTQAKVLSIGKECVHVSVGCSVLVDWSKCKPVKMEGVQLAVVSEDDILAIV